MRLRESHSLLAYAASEENKDPALDKKDRKKDRVHHAPRLERFYKQYDKNDERYKHYSPDQHAENIHEGQPGVRVVEEFEGIVKMVTQTTR